MRGSALLITMLVTSILTVLGLGFLAMADTESLIASTGRNSEQLVHVAETGARMVKAWFDQPVSGDPSVPAQVLHRFLGAYDLRNPVYYDRTRRIFDHDGDPNTPPVTADGTAGRPYHRQDRTLWSPSPYLDLFQKPYRGDRVIAFMGTEEGPDILIEDRPGVVDFLDILNQRLFTEQMQTGRISRIAIYAPPSLPFDGTVRRGGVCSVKVTAAKYRRMTSVGIVPVVAPGAEKIGEVTVRVVLSEVPGAAANGPLESCGSMTVTGPLNARWGRVIAGGDVVLSSDLHADVPSAFPYESFFRRISGSAPGDDYYDWFYDADQTIEDPWLKVILAGDIAGFAGGGEQPLPYDQSAPIDEDHSNLFQRIVGVECGHLNYSRMKSAALSGEEAARYFAYDIGTGLFREHGAGSARSIRDWTHNQEGLFFFDTKDGLIPNGFGPGNPATNLTPPLVIEGTDWSFSGLLYANAESLEIGDVSGVNRVLIPPGEPFDDANANGRFDTGEDYVNLWYPATVIQGAPGSAFTKNPAGAQTGNATSADLEFYSYTTSAAYDAQGIPITGQVSLFGVLYNAGDIVAEGTARHYGSLIAGGDVVQTTTGAATPEIFFDQRLNTGTWPPPEITFPRTHLSLWIGPS